MVTLARMMAPVGEVRTPIERREAGPTRRRAAGLFCGAGLRASAMSWSWPRLAQIEMRWRRGGRNAVSSRESHKAEVSGYPKCVSLRFARFPHFLAWFPYR
jgi:hypothetical protein